jgi:two-component system, OmpR family, phosphate regulon sensor histidine kinase PhoR
MDLYSSTGNTIPVDVRACAITYGDRDAIYLLIHDVTETRRAREEILAANGRLKELDQLKTNFLTTVSHELRTPLTSISWSIDSLSDLIPDGDDKIQKSLKIIREDNLRLSGLIEELLSFSRIEAGKLNVAFQEVDLSQMVQKSVEEMMHLAQKKSLEISLVSVQGRLWVQADTEHLRRVVVNLLDNAIKYTPDHGTIAIQLSTHAAMAKLEITDSGIGISAEDLPHIFEKFYRSDALDVQHERGTGLGLAIVQSIIEAHEGTIDVKSSRGQGTTVTVHMPLTGVS